MIALRDVWGFWEWANQYEPLKNVAHLPACFEGEPVVEITDCFTWEECDCWFVSLKLGEHRTRVTRYYMDVPLEALKLGRWSLNDFTADAPHPCCGHSA